jgi:hypothetical protein
MGARWYRRERRRGYDHGVNEPPVDPPKKDALLPHDDDLPPVVARLVVEVRSDGTRTVARGGLEDHQTGQRVALSAEAGSPLELSRLLLKSLLATPARVARAIVDEGKASVRARARRLFPRLLPGPRPRDE